MQPTSRQVLGGYKYKLKTLHIDVREHDWMVVYVLNTLLQFNASFNTTVPTTEVYSDL
jgi:hypothetical protein